MSCQSITLADGTQLLVNVKPGQKLTTTDIEALSEFNRILHMQGPPTEHPEPGVDGYEIGGRHARRSRHHAQ